VVLSFYRVALEPNKTVLHITLKSGPIAKSGFQRVSLRPEAVKTACRYFSIIITGLKPGANKNFPPRFKNRDVLDLEYIWLRS
jgi:hypothetical protein